MITILSSNYSSNEAYCKTYETSELNWSLNQGSTASIPSLYGDMELVDFTENDQITPLLLDMIGLHSIFGKSSTYKIG
jgi:hypothetical protein